MQTNPEVIAASLQEVGQVALKQFLTFTPEWIIMAHSEKKTERMRKQTVQNLKKIADSGSLSSAAAQFELYRRAAKDEAPRT